MFTKVTIMASVVSIPFNKFLKYGGFAWRHCRTHGLGPSAAALCRELIFDLRHGVDTTAPRELDSLNVPAAARLEAVQYQGADPRLVRELLNKLGDDHNGVTFIDYGCGKGRVLLIAAQHGFKNLIGVEFSPELSLTCNQNLTRAARHLGDARFDIVTTDAALFDPPPGPLVAFFYNPFSGGTLKAVVQRLQSKARHFPVTVVYVNPLGAEVFTDHGFQITHRILQNGHTTGIVAGAGLPRASL